MKVTAYRAEREGEFVTCMAEVIEITASQWDPGFEDVTAEWCPEHRPVSIEFSANVGSYRIGDMVKVGISAVSPWEWDGDEKVPCPTDGTWPWIVQEPRTWERTFPARGRPGFWDFNPGEQL